MLGHEDVGDEFELEFCAGGGDGVDEPAARAVAREELLAAEAGTGEVVGVAGDVVAFAVFVEMREVVGVVGHGRDYSGGRISGAMSCGVGAPLDMSDCYFLIEFG